MFENEHVEFKFGFVVPTPPIKHYTELDVTKLCHGFNDIYIDHIREAVIAKWGGQLAYDTRPLHDQECIGCFLVKGSEDISFIKE